MEVLCAKGKRLPSYQGPRACPLDRTRLGKQGAGVDGAHPAGGDRACAEKRPPVDNIGVGDCRRMDDAADADRARDPTARALVAPSDGVFLVVR
eukprot:scaffold299588_cov31-Tisochrysis_lutea.AAC.2